MKTFSELLLLLVVVIILICLLFSFAQTIFSPTLNKDFLSSVCINENCFQVASAKTQSERERGLMNVGSLDKDKGTLFIFDKDGIYPFWMKNTLINLDIIWIDSNKKIVFIKENAEPCKNFICPSIVPLVKASYVLEINAGLCQEIGLKLGDELKMNIN